MTARTALVLALAMAAAGVAARAQSVPAPGDSMTDAAGIEFVWVPAGMFRMGSTSAESAWNERPVTAVRISEGFWLGKYEVTQAQWQAVMGSNPSYFPGCGQCPVERVSWNDSQAFIARLNAREGASGYRLPTEAEWEYAARAGTTGDRYGDLDQVAWHAGNSEARTRPVGGKAPNSWGLHDMLGNVFEWVQDWWGEYPGGAVTDPRGPASREFGVFRGGSWIVGARHCRSTNRYDFKPGSHLGFLGFRLARTAS